jgi:hypothetical protein
VKSAVDESSGFGALDAAVGDPGSALEGFSLRWKAFRGTSAPGEVETMAEAILAGDVRKLGELISGSDPAGVRIDRDKLQLALPRWTKGPAQLLDIAAAVGGAPLRYQLEFFELKPTLETLYQAVATGDSDIVRTIWDRLPPDLRTRLGELAMTAADFHHIDVVLWLLVDAKRSAHVAVRRFRTFHHLLDIQLRLREIGPARFVVGSMAEEFEDELMTRLVAAHDGRDIASLNAFCDAADRLSKTIVVAVTEKGESVCGGYLDPAWREGGSCARRRRELPPLHAEEPRAGRPDEVPDEGRPLAGGVQVARLWLVLRLLGGRTSTVAGIRQAVWAGTIGACSAMARRSSTADRTPSGWRAGSSGRSRESVLQIAR